QEIPFVSTEASGTALFEESLLKNGTLEYELILNNIRDITGIYIEYNNTIPLKEIYSNPIIPDICCLSLEASEPGNFYLNGIIENDINITPLDLIKSGISLQVDDNASDPLNGNLPIIEILIPNNKSNNLTGLFESGLVFLNVETKSHPPGEIRGQIIDKVQILE
ncbi:MAG: CHRD domain-containing protein, partial [Nitrosopumilus sp.]|nr:CHRD domain-containing protein [Nitrosopumilus sp.]